MAKTSLYEDKFTTIRQGTFFDLLPASEQHSLKSLAFQHRLTYQEFRLLCEISRDLQMWQEPGLADFIDAQPDDPAKKILLERISQHYESLRAMAKIYPADNTGPRQRDSMKITVESSEKKIEGMCPVASPETVCCNLRTIDAVENCVFGCSYCTIQTFYESEVVFDAGIREKLARIKIPNDRYVHYGTGQSSDSLAWGNRNGNLDALCDFARENPNVMLEFKTKSDNIRYFTENEIPPNVVCSWSLNTDTIIANEEHFTANLERRISAARAVADRGVKVAFHFHPMVYYDNWDADYAAIAKQLLQKFDSSEVLFISMGSVTFIKPVLKKIRKMGNATRIAQMPMIPDPHGKLTYPDRIKTTMFRSHYQNLAPWHDRVFFYLCMEKKEIWTPSLGFVFPDNDTFESAFLSHCFSKIYPKENL